MAVCANSAWHQRQQQLQQNVATYLRGTNCGGA